MKLPNNDASSMGGDTSMPNGDASFMPQGEMMGQEMDGANGDMAQSLDQNMGGPEEEMNPEMGDMEMEQEDDSTIGIINQLSDEDKDAVRAYAESLLSRNENDTEQGQEMGTGEDDVAGAGADMPMMENVIFSKKQLKMLKESLKNPKSN